MAATPQYREVRGEDLGQIIGIVDSTVVIDSNVEDTPAYRALHREMFGSRDDTRGDTALADAQSSKKAAAREASMAAFATCSESAPTAAGGILSFYESLAGVPIAGEEAAAEVVKGDNTNTHVYALLIATCAHVADAHTSDTTHEVLVQFDSNAQLENADDNDETYGTFNSGLPDGWVADGPVEISRFIPAQAAKTLGFVVFDPELKP